MVSFECEALKADKAAEDHIKQFMPKLAGMDAVGKLYFTSFGHVKTVRLGVFLNVWLVNGKECTLPRIPALDYSIRITCN